MDSEARYATAVLTIPEGGTASNIIDVSAFRTMSYVCHNADLTAGTGIYATGSFDGVNFNVFDGMHSGQDGTFLPLSLGAFRYLRIESLTAELVPAAQTAAHVLVVGLKS